MEEQTLLPDRAKILRNIAITFVTLTAILSAFIGYTALSRATVAVKLGSVEKEVVYRITLAEEVFGREPIPGSLVATFLETTDEAKDTFLVAGDGVNDGKAGGVVTIENNTDRSQPLVATTRLLGPNNVLFRLTESVRVPARGSVVAVAEADEEGEKYIIGPTRFTIPGLSTALQKDIYAVSISSMVPGGGVKRELSEQDLENARQTLRQRLLEDARKVFKSQVSEGDLVDDDFIVEVLEENASAKAGDKVAALTMSVRIKIIGVSFDKEELQKRIAKEAGGGVIVTDPESLRYTLTNYDPVKRVAVLNGKATVGASMDKESSIFAVANFVGSTTEEVKSFLSNYEGIENVEVKISPYWQRRLPKVPSRINVVFE